MNPTDQHGQQGQQGQEDQLGHGGQPEQENQPSQLNPQAQPFAPSQPIASEQQLQPYISNIPSLAGPSGQARLATKWAIKLGTDPASCTVGGGRATHEPTQPWFSPWRVNELLSLPGNGDNYPLAPYSTTSELQTAAQQATLPKPPDEELDAILNSEELQRTYVGLRVHEMQELQRWKAVPLHPGPNSRDDPNFPRLTVDEKNWFRLFQRDHWMTFDRNVADYLDGEALDAIRRAGHLDPAADVRSALGTWRVENDNIWHRAEFRDVIDLANRLTIATTEDAWMNSLMQPAKYLEFVPHPGRKFIPILDPREHIPVPQVAWRVNQMRHLFSFADRESSYLKSTNIPTLTLGYTSTYTRLGTNEQHSASMLSVPYIRGLLEERANDAERVTLKTMLASLVCHELMHAVAARSSSIEHAFVAPRYDNTGRCFYDLDNIQSYQEMGCSWEERMYGGQFHFLVFGHPLQRGSGISLVSSYNEYNRHGLLDPVNYTLPDRQLWIALPFREALLLEDIFWKVGYARFGREVLKAPRLLVSTRKLDLPTGRQTVARWVTKNGSKAVIPHLPPRLMPDVQRMKRMLRRTRLDVHRRRSPWHRDAYLRWKSTPYSGVHYRDWVLSWQLTARASMGTSPARQERVAWGLLADVKSMFNFVGPASTRFWRSVAALWHAGLPQHPPGPESLLQPLIDPASPFLPPDPPRPQRGPWSWDASSKDPSPDFPHIERLAYEVLDERGIASNYVVATNPSGRFQTQWGAAQTALDSRLMYIALARDTFEGYFALLPQSPVLEQMCRNWCTWLEAGVKAVYGGNGPPVPVHIHPWLLATDFRLPPYQEETSPTPLTMWGFGSLLLEQRAKVEWGRAPTRFGTPSSQSPAVSESGPPIVRAALARIFEVKIPRPTTTYFSVGEIANHRQLTDLWLLKANGRELDVYDFSGIVEELRLTPESIESILARCEYGLKLGDMLPARIEERLARLNPLGRALIWRAAEEVPEHDGNEENETPLWIILGRTIYDITDFELPASERELEILLESAPGGNPMQAFIDAGKGDALNDLLEKLAPFKCGMLRASVANTPSSNMPFTEEEITWHEYIDTRMYTIINGDVYDMTEYIEFHPGGSAVIAKQAAGRDCTQEFMDSHPGAATILEQMQYLKIGHIVASFQSIEQIDSARYQVLLFGHVYTIEPLRVYRSYQQPSEQKMAAANFDKLADHTAREGKAIWDGLSKYLAQEVVDLGLANTEEDNAPLQYLLNHPEYIVGKLVTPRERLPTMSLDELALCTGEEGEDWYNEAWVGVGEWVYNVTTMIQCATESIRNTLLPWCGRVIDNFDVASYVKDNYGARIVAKLVAKQSTDPKLRGQQQLLAMATRFRRTSRSAEWEESLKPQKLEVGDRIIQKPEPPQSSSFQTNHHAVEDVLMSDAVELDGDEEREEKRELRETLERDAQMELHSQTSRLLALGEYRMKRVNDDSGLIERRTREERERQMRDRRIQLRDTDLERDPEASRKRPHTIGQSKKTQEVGFESPSEHSQTSSEYDAAAIRAVLDFGADEAPRDRPRQIPALSPDIRPLLERVETSRSTWSLKEAEESQPVPRIGKPLKLRPGRFAPGNSAAYQYLPSVDADTRTGEGSNDVDISFNRNEFYKSIIPDVVREFDARSRGVQSLAAKRVKVENNTKRPGDGAAERGVRFADENKATRGLGLTGLGLWGATDGKYGIGAQKVAAKGYPSHDEQVEVLENKPPADLQECYRQISAVDGHSRVRATTARERSKEVEVGTDTGTLWPDTRAKANEKGEKRAWLKPSAFAKQSWGIEKDLSSPEV